MTTIEWTRGADGSEGETWNPIRARNLATGGVGHYCVKVSDGCRNCYAERLQPRYRNPIRYAAQDVHLVEVFLDERVLEKPLHWSRGRNIFPCSMTDLFGAFVKDEWIERILDVARRTPQHTYQCLTKRADRMLDFLTRKAPPLNWWQGVSVERHTEAEERIPLLLQTPAQIRWLSIEPILGDVGLRNIRGRVPWMPIGHDHFDALTGAGRGIDWVVVGGESGPAARSTVIGYIRGVVRGCRAAGVPVFVKQLGRKPTNREGVPHVVFDPKGGRMSEWPEDLRVREFPITEGSAR